MQTKQSKGEGAGEVNYRIIYKAWPLTGRDVCVAKSATMRNAQKMASRWSLNNPGAVIFIQ